MEIGSIIRSARNGAGLSQEQAAEALGVSRQTVSNWENGKTYPDIISVIRMSEIYSVSLDRLLKEESSVKQSYREYLEESTNAVKSNERKSKLILLMTTLGIWALALIAFMLTRRGVDRNAYGLAVMWAVLPVTFFAASCVIALRGWFGKFMYLAAPVCGIMYALSGNAAYFSAGEMAVRSVTWPDLTRLPIGLLISAAGLAAGKLISIRRSKANEKQKEEET